MPNLVATQGSTTVAGSGANSTVQPGIVSGQNVASSISGITPASYAWTLAVPAGSDTVLSSATVAAPTWLPDFPGDYALSLNGTYTLPLNVAQVAASTYLGPIVPANLTPGQMPTPAQGLAIAADSTTPGSLLTKDSSGNLAPVALVRSGITAARPTTGLFVGYCFYDTTLPKPIFWSGSVWKDATGATV